MPISFNRSTLYTPTLPPTSTGMANLLALTENGPIIEVKIPFSNSAYSVGLNAAKSIQPPLKAKSAISDPRLKISGVSPLAKDKRLLE